MKKIIYILALATAFAACNPETLQDIYDDIPDKPYAVTGIEYTLADADYTAISTAAVADATDEVTTNMSKDVDASKTLNSFASPNAYVPSILAQRYRTLEIGSAVNVTYAYKDDAPAYVRALGAAPSHTVTTDEYQSAGATMNYFTPSTSAVSSLPAILSAANPDAVQGDLVVVTYKTADTDPGSVSPTRLAEDFSGYIPATAAPYTKWDQNGWTQVITQGDGTKYWQVRSRVVSGTTTLYAQMSANGGTVEVSESYVISPLVDLSQTTENNFSFDICVGYWNYAGLSVLITEDANCLTTPATVTWTDVTSSFTIPTEPTGGYAPEYVSAGTLDLDINFSGKKIYIAFKYNGDNTDSEAPQTTTFQIDNVLVKGTAPDGGGDVPTRDETAIYTFNGTTWVVYRDAISVQPADYAAMGVAYLTTEQASAYLPTYLMSYYGMPGDKKAVVYRTSSGNAALEFIKTENGFWALETNISKMTAQFIHSGEGGWVFDPTVNHTMTAADHQLVVDYVLNDPRFEGSYRSSYTNEEFYFGFNAHYINVSFRLSYRASYAPNDPDLMDKTDEEKIVVLWARMRNEGMPKFLELKYPNAVVDVQGIPVMYNITVDIFYPDGTTYQSGTDKFSYTFTYKVLTNGSAGVAPTFEFVDVVSNSGRPIF